MPVSFAIQRTSHQVMECLSSSTLPIYKLGFMELLKKLAAVLLLFFPSHLKRTQR
jgi:hypothetical protein